MVGWTKKRKFTETVFLPLCGPWMTIPVVGDTGDESRFFSGGHGTVRIEISVCMQGSRTLGESMCGKPFHQSFPASDDTSL